MPRKRGTVAAETTTRTLSQAKTLGGVGSIIIFIPFLGLIGYILLILAVKEISAYLQDRGIFYNTLIAAATGILGAFAGSLVIVFGALGSGRVLGTSGVVDSLLVGWVLLMASAVFLRRAYGAMTKRLGVGAFRIAAALYLAGAVLTIILVGFVLLFIAEIFQAVAYFSMPDRPGEAISVVAATSTTATTPAAAAAASPSSIPTQASGLRFCTSCGAQILPSAQYCYNCGAKQ